MNRSVDPVVLQTVCAALTGILAAQRTRPDYKLVCREAVSVGFRTATALREDARRSKLKAQAIIKAQARRRA